MIYFFILGKLNSCLNQNTVKLGEKKRFDKEQIGDKEPIPRLNANLLHKDKEHLALRNNFRVTKKFLENQERNFHFVRNFL